MAGNTPGAAKLQQDLGEKDALISQLGEHIEDKESASACKTLQSPNFKGKRMAPVRNHVGRFVKFCNGLIASASALADKKKSADTPCAIPVSMMLSPYRVVHRLSSERCGN